MSKQIYFVTGRFRSPCCTLKVEADSREDAIDWFAQELLENADYSDICIDEVKVCPELTKSDLEALTVFEDALAKAYSKKVNEIKDNE